LIKNNTLCYRVSKINKTIYINFQSLVVMNIAVSLLENDIIIMSLRLAGTI